MIKQIMIPAFEPGATLLRRTSFIRNTLGNKKDNMDFERPQICA
jgi:hypothetical protein